MSSIGTMNSDEYIPGGRLPGESLACWVSRVWSLGFVPACGGTERWTPCRDGKEYLYCVDLRTLETCWVDRGDMPRFDNPYSS